MFVTAQKEDIKGNQCFHVSGLGVRITAKTLINDLVHWRIIVSTTTVRITMRSGCRTKTPGTISWILTFSLSFEKKSRYLNTKGSPQFLCGWRTIKKEEMKMSHVLIKKTHNKTRSWVSFPLLSEQWPKTYSLKVVMDHLKRTEKNSNPQILDTLNHTGNQWSETKYKSSCQKPQLWWRKSEEFSSPLLYLCSPRPFNTLTLLCPSIIFLYQCIWCFTLTSDESRDGGPLGPPTKAR